MSQMDRTGTPAAFGVSRVSLDAYQTHLAEPSRRPGRGGNTRAWHRHVLTINGERHSFLALGQRKWVFAKDIVSFSWSWDASLQYRNIDPASIMVEDKAGKPVERGERGGKAWRTANERHPGRKDD